MHHTPAPWHMEIYLNERNEAFPPGIIGKRNNYPIAVCCGLDKDTDQANGRVISAAPELLEACEAAVIALLEDRSGVPSDANLRAVTLCRAARTKARE